MSSTTPSVRPESSAPRGAPRGASMPRQDGRRLWTRVNFTVKFAMIIAVAGCLIAVIPLTLATRVSRDQAGQRAADKAGIVVNLVAAQAHSLQAFASGMVQELTPDVLARRATIIQTTLGRYSSLNAASDVVGVHGQLGDAAALAGAPLPATGPVFTSLVAALPSGQVVAGPGGAPWLVGKGTVPGTDETAFIARPISTEFLDALVGTVATPADNAGVAIVRQNRVVAAGSSISGHDVAIGTPLSAELAGVVASSQGGRDVSVDGRVAGADAQPLGGGFVALVTSGVLDVGVPWEPVVVLIGLIVVAMVIIVGVVQVDLRRPLRRLDRAVAAMAQDEYDVPVPAAGNAEIDRLARSFEDMRQELRLTLVGTRARAMIAAELNARQPLERALDVVSAQLRQSTGADAALIVVSGSEMTDSFAVVDGLTTELEVNKLLTEDGPIGTAYRQTGADARVVAAPPASREYASGLRSFLTAPLRMGPTYHGVLAVARSSGRFTPADASLIASSAEQVALALERYRFIAMVQRQATIDDLTGLYNHRFLVDYLSQQVALAERMNTPLAILLIDLDHFKKVNDEHGHPVGDEVLHAFAQTLTGSVRRADLAARYGGEEFIVVMANTGAADARGVAEKIRTAVETMRVPVHGGGWVSCTVSVGGAAYPEDTTTARELLATADVALYDAKRAGRNRVCMAGGDQGQSEVPGNVNVFTRRSAQ